MIRLTLVCLSLSLIAGFVSAGTIYVDDDLLDYPNADFTKIQDAVNAASPGDTISVYPGIYTENIDVNKESLTIESVYGRDVTLVQAADPKDHVFEIRANNVTTRGFAVLLGAGSSRYGIYLEHADQCVFGK